MHFFVFLLFKNLFYVFNSLNLKGNSFLPAQLLFVRSCLLLCTLLFCFYILYPFISISFYFNFRKSAQCSNFTIRRITIKKAEFYIRPASHWKLTFRRRENTTSYIEKNKRLFWNLLSALTATDFYRGLQFLKQSYMRDHQIRWNTQQSFDMAYSWWVPWM